MSTHASIICYWRQFLLFTLVFSLCAGAASAQTTTFTYQGRLTDGGTIGHATYDMQFKLYDSASTGTGTQIGSTITNSTVTVANGVFTVQLDFGPSAFPGADRYLEISVRHNSGESYVTLSPRQQITSTPYAIRTLSAALADTAANANSLGGQPASNYVLTIDSRLSDGRAPTAGSSNYVQNQTALAQAADFNINGNGTAGGTLSANTLNATTQYNISGSRILTGNATSANTFGGLSAGQSDTTGSFSNSFFGFQSGQSNTTGFRNSFFGTQAGKNNTGNSNSFFGSGAGFSNAGGTGNSFFGESAGNFNTSGSGNSFFGSGTGVSNTSGGGNSFFGDLAGNSNSSGIGNTFVGDASGLTNTIGSNNTLVGVSSNVGANNLDHATAVGANAVVNASNTVVLGRSVDTVQVPGTLNIAGTFSAASFSGNGSALTSLNAGNITSGTLAAANGGTGLTAAGASGNYLRSNGTSWTSSAIASADIPSGSANYIQNQTATTQAADFNINGNGTAGGTLSGNVVNAASQFNINGSRVLIAGGFSSLSVGIGAGPISGSRTNFFGAGAGAANTSTAFSNNFFGFQAGASNTVGTRNSFFGDQAGQANTGTENTFIGNQAGLSHHSGDSNVALGAGADVADGLDNATAIGAGAVVSDGNSVVLGRALDTVVIPGRLVVTGTVVKGGGSFKIDDPLDPENKYLSHSFVESPDMMNIYNGNITTDSKGAAAITLPAYFEALNRDFRYQLTVIGQFAQAVVSEEVRGNQFRIKTDKPNVKVSWQVTGIRHDAYADAYRIPVEEDKPENKRGTYLHPDAFGSPARNRANSSTPR